MENIVFFVWLSLYLFFVWLPFCISNSISVGEKWTWIVSSMLWMGLIKAQTNQVLSYLKFCNVSTASNVYPRQECWCVLYITKYPSLPKMLMCIVHNKTQSFPLILHYLFFFWLESEYLYVDGCCSISAIFSRSRKINASVVRIRFPHLLHLR